jgi:hypothetical protein
MWHPRSCKSNRKPESNYRYGSGQAKTSISLVRPPQSLPLLIAISPPLMWLFHEERGTVPVHAYFLGHENTLLLQRSSHFSYVLSLLAPQKRRLNIGQREKVSVCRRLSISVEEGFFFPLFRFVFVRGKKKKKK